MPTRSFSVNTGVQSQKINTQEQMIEEYKEAERKKKKKTIIVNTPRTAKGMRGNNNIFYRAPFHSCQKRCS